MPSRRILANAIRALSMDAVQAANSGHPGAPMGMADIAEVLWNDFLKHNPANPQWVDRDRFVLSNGHGSMLLYSVLHLSGYALPLEQIKQFRQLHSMTPGHPEYRDAPGVETTTGPLGQGITNAVGMAIAEKVLAARFNKKDFSVVDHYTYVFLGDGCLMEGISHEACSLAGVLGLGKLIAFYDDNNISIDGEVGGWFADDTPRRFEAYGWHVVPDVDGHDPDAVKRAIEQARAETEKPTLICCKTIIGWGSPNKQGTAATHGAPLGEDEVIAARKELGWEYSPFEIPEEVYSAWDAKQAGAKTESAWQELFNLYKQKHPEQAAEFARCMQGGLPADWSKTAEDFIASLVKEAPKVATRKASQMALDGFGPILPEFIGGSADLTGSNNTLFKKSKAITRDDADGNYIYYGVREFAMSAIMNGLALHGGFIPYGGTFLTFSDYARNAVRMAALMKIGSIFVYTHDSIGLGEDGPTHQSIEHLASLRIIPNMSLWRPCDAVETAVAWKHAVERRDGPTCLALTRQGVPHQPRDKEQLKSIERGGYVLVDCAGMPDVILIATGSEVGLAVDAAKELSAKKHKVRVVSMPNTNVFAGQPAEYRNNVLPAAVAARVAVEAGVSTGWSQYVGAHGAVIGIDQFGKSAPAKDVFEYFGFTVANVVTTCERVINTANSKS
ncbi:MAG: transketolase [Gammaproteobacteria bacterium]|nr:transketolase [Gammaproteobacteria bacterium]